MSLDCSSYTFIRFVWMYVRGWVFMHPRHRGVSAYRDRQLTPNFVFWVEIFCVPTCFHMRIPKLCPSVCPYPEKRNHPSFVNISPTLVIDTLMERSSRVLQQGNRKILFSKMVFIEFRLVLKCLNHPSYVNISLTVVIDTSKE